MTLGKSLERMRKDRGLSFKRLGKLTGLSTATLWDIEQDKKSPTVKTCMQIAACTAKLKEGEPTRTDAWAWR